jgi:hypothetical protein
MGFWHDFYPSNLCNPASLPKTLSMLKTPFTLPKTGFLQDAFSFLLSPYRPICSTAAAILFMPSTTCHLSRHTPDFRLSIS